MALRSLTPVAITALPNASTPLSGTEAVAVVQSGTTSQVAVSDLTAGRAVSASALTASSGNLTFSGTAQRITGDFSNATIANRVLFQTSTANGATVVGVIPNGTGTITQFAAYGGSDPANAQVTRIDARGGTESRIESTYAGTPASGTYLPMTFYTGGSEAMRIDTNRRVAIGTISANTNTLLTVNGNIAVANPTRNAVSSNQIGVWTSDDPASNDRASIAFVTTVGASSSNSYIAFSTNNYGVSGGERMRIDASGNVVQNTAAVATNATAGFLWITSCAGAPTGAPTAPYTNAAALVCDTTNNRLYVRVGSTWRYATLT